MQIRPDIRCPARRAVCAAEVHLWCILLSVFYLAWAPRAGAAEAPVSKEYQVKAAFIYSFTKFVEWAPQRFPASDSPIVIGVLGKNPFGDELEKLVQNRKVNGRGFVVKIVYSTVDLPPVHLLFVPAGEEIRLVEKSMDLIQSPGTLTVGETDQFFALGGIINFVTEVDKVRFQISRSATERAGVKISAQLLKLALVLPKKG